MDDLTKILITSSLTVIGGVLVFVAGQLLGKFVIDPMHEFKKTIGEVRFILAFYAPTIHTPAARDKERSDKAAEALIKSSCELLAGINAVPFYGSLSALFPRFLPSMQHVVAAAVQLRGLSTYVHETGDRAIDSLEVIASRVAQIENALGFEPLD
jgi:hypothetical protein